jgi:pyroglutamyl-peptidase
VLARVRPEIMVMFGVAPRSRHLRIETRACNVLAPATPDATGIRPAATVIAPDGPAQTPLRAPVQRLLAAARSAGVPAALSHDAGNYLCNYLCWRMNEPMSSPPRLAAFVHIPAVRPPPAPRFDDMLRAGEAILRAVVAAPRQIR